MKNVYIYLLTLVIFFAIDFVWLAFISRNLYQGQIGHLMSDKIKYIPALVFYLFFVIGIVYFAVIPGLNENSIRVAALNAAFLGFLAYATYDLTNYATLKDWPLQVVIIDVIWGTFLCGSTSVVTFWVWNLIRGR